MSNITLERLQFIAKKCRAGLVLETDPHRGAFTSAKEFLQAAERNKEKEEKQFIDPEVLKEIVRLDKLVVLQAYVYTPMKSEVVIHYDLEAAIDLMYYIVERA